MSDDLISRKIIKAQVEAIRDCWAISPYVSVDDMKLYSEVINVVLQEISDCPTAFDKEYDDAWFCKNPDCKSPVLTSTMLGAHPSGCPKIYEWNRREGEQNG